MWRWLTRFLGFTGVYQCVNGGKLDNFLLGGRPRRSQYGDMPPGSGHRAQRDALRRRVMADESNESSRRAVSLALAGLAVVGWLAAGFIWWQGGQTRSQLTEQLTATERARESLASDLQNLQKTAGVAADLKKQAADAEKALSDATAARASAQNELTDLNKQISDAKLAISGAQEEASAKTRDLQAVDARLKDESDRVAALQSQDQTLAAEQTRLQGESDAARKALTDAQAQAVSAQKLFETLQDQIHSATAELNSIQVQIRAAKSTAPSEPNPNP
jgi:DNA repair exonuclease SbcCD ATPase subunit